MIDLGKLTVSLTKHGAHKIDYLLERFDKDHIIENVENTIPGINIDAAQVSNILGVDKNGVVPAVWNKVRSNQDERHALVFLAIIFSHYKLIEAMSQSSDRGKFSGTIVRGRVLNGKEFTNFSHTIHELRFAMSSNEDLVSYSLFWIFKLGRFNEIFKEYLFAKFNNIERQNPLSFNQELENYDFHKVFSIRKDQFNSWLAFGSLDSMLQIDKVLDVEYFLDTEMIDTHKDFCFRAGHKTKVLHNVPIHVSKKKITAVMLHNNLQERLFQFLATQYGSEFVGTEIDTGSGTMIDLVVLYQDKYWFYEIKTAETAKACIRQALPQLLEYAYWSGKVHNVEKLIIVGVSQLTNDADRYLTFLRDNFALPIEYHQFGPD